MSNVFKTEAIIVDSIRWKESSKIVTLFTRESGIIKVIARGVFKNKSSFSGKIESLNRIEAIINSRSSRSLQILSEADVMDTFSGIRLDLERLPYALAILELIKQIIRESHPDSVFYDFIVVLLDAIKVAEKPNIIFCYFLIKLVSFLGFKPNFEYCLSCKQKPASQDVYFSMDNGAIFCNNCSVGAGITRRLKLSEIKILKTLQSYPHKKITSLDLNLSSLQSSINLLIDYLNYHTENNIKVKSLSLLIS